MNREEDTLLLDVRLIERNLRDGKLTRERLAAHLESLEDVSHLADYVVPTVEPSDRISYSRRDDYDEP